MQPDFHQLALLPLFAGIDEEDLPAMLTCLGSFQKNYKKGEFILLENNENQLPRCKHSSTVLGSYVTAHSTCLSLLLPQD